MPSDGRPKASSLAARLVRRGLELAKRVACESITDGMLHVGSARCEAC